MSVQGRTVLITGATTGIGKATAIELAHRGAELVLVARDPKKAEATLAAIRARTPDARLDVLYADLSSLAEVRKLATEFQARHPRLHVLLNNAGAIVMERRLTVDGFEQTFAVNHLAYFLLTNLLLDRLKASAPARIINVASGAHRSGRIDFDDLQHEKRFSGYGAYCDSKLANILFTRELARRIEGSGVTANCLRPGLVATGFGQGEGTKLFKWAFKLGKPFMLSPEKGAATSIYLASSPEVEGQNGLYWGKCKPARPWPRALDDASAKRLWDVSLKLTGLA
jgi:NAD(P)-dependent dehydrogenase (short-subunit alcohol dehydrogenase family)